MNFKFWKKKSTPKPTPEASHALREAEIALIEAQILTHEAQRIADRLFKSRQENHYAERIKAAYEMGTR